MGGKFGGQLGWTVLPAHLMYSDGDAQCRALPEGSPC